MGYLLKEMLKTLSEVNQWCYAVFWRIGCQNPKLLIWEECFHEPGPCRSFPPPPIAGMESTELHFEALESCWDSAESQVPKLEVQSEDKVGPLIHKMMVDNQIQILGQGLVGQAAFIGKHLWVLSQNYVMEIYPLEVQNELRQQFSSGMKQTIVVITVPNHGVVQFGSTFTIVENRTFLDDVKSLMIELHCVPSALTNQIDMISF